MTTIVTVCHDQIVPVTVWLPHGRPSGAVSTSSSSHCCAVISPNPLWRTDLSESSCPS